MAASDTCIFDQLPEELLAIIVSFVGETKDVGRLSLSCKRFLQLVENDQIVWKRLAQDWWDQKGFKSRTKFTLEQIFRECGKMDWRWFAICFANERKDGLSWRKYQGITAQAEMRRVLDVLCFGDMKNGKLNGFGIELTLGDESFVDVGPFVDGNLSGEGVRLDIDGRIRGHFVNGSASGWGVMTFSAGTFEGDRYEGEWKHGRKHGHGIYTWKSGTQYEGQFCESRGNGFGKMSFVDGFEFQCQWKDGAPLDEQASIHPKVVARLARNKCTGHSSEKTEEYAQFLNQCQECGFGFCKSCYQTCHPQHNNWLSRWTVKTRCRCSIDHRVWCHKRAENSKKKQKLQ